MCGGGIISGFAWLFAFETDVYRISHQGGVQMYIVVITATVARALTFSVNSLRGWVSRVVPA